jgi:hypothetical protein
MPTPELLPPMTATTTQIATLFKNRASTKQTSATAFRLVHQLDWPSRLLIAERGKDEHHGEYQCLRADRTLDDCTRWLTICFLA